jgi:hypothetical protein
MKRRFAFLRQGAFYGGIVLGIIVLPALLIGVNWTLQRIHSHPSTGTATPVTSGNMTISLSDDLLTTGMRLGLQRVQDKIPFTIKDVAAKTQKGDSLELDADGPIPSTIPVIGGVLGGQLVSMSVTMAPVVDKTGHIDFKITQLSVVGLDASFFGLSNTLLESTLNGQFSNVGDGSIVNGLNYQLLSVATAKGALLVTAKLYQSTGG